MALEYDEKGKFYTDVIKKEVVLTQLQTPTFRIRGYVHVREGERLSDEINRDILFIAVTHAEIYDLAGEQLYTSEFLAVNREQIVWLMPVEDSESTPG
jgi:hypothetical protein